MENEGKRKVKGRKRIEGRRSTGSRERLKLCFGGEEGGTIEYRMSA